MNDFPLNVISRSKRKTKITKPFQIRLGSKLKALSTIAKELNEHKAGSDCVTNCSDKGKKLSILPWPKASRNKSFPFRDDNEMRLRGNIRLWNDEDGAALAIGGQCECELWLQAGDKIKEQDLLDINKFMHLCFLIILEHMLVLSRSVFGCVLWAV